MLSAVGGQGGASVAVDGNNILLHPGRDVAYCLPKVVRVAVANFDRGAWKQAIKAAELSGCTREQIGDAIVRLVDFIQEQPDDEESLAAGVQDTMANSLKRSGFLDCSETAQVLSIAYLLLPVLGMFWRGVRDAGAKPQDSTYKQQLAAAMQEAMKAFKEQT